MRILFITDNFPPEVNAPATRTYEHCKHWVERGADVTVITCAPNFPQGRVYGDYKNSLVQKEIIDGIKVIRVWSYIAANEGVVKRTLDYISFAFSAFWASLFQKTDVIIATSPQFFTTWTAYTLSLVKGKPWIFELRDLWPESIKAVGVLKEGVIFNILEKMELMLYDKADLIIPNSPAFKQNLIERGVDEKKVHVIPNGANLQLFTAQEKNEKLIKKFDLEGKFIVGYLGTHGLAHNLDFILDCAASLDDKEIGFLFIGDGAAKEDLIKQADRLSLENVTFLEPIPKEDVPAYLSIFDVSLVPLKKSDTFKTVIPSKIFEAAAMRIPILLGVEGLAKCMIDKYEAGLFYTPENQKEFLARLYLIKNNTQLYQQLAEGGEKLARDYDRSNLAGKMYQIIERKNNKKG